MKLVTISSFSNDSLIIWLTDIFNVCYHTFYYCLLALWLHNRNKNTILEVWFGGQNSHKMIVIEGVFETYLQNHS